MAAPSQLEEPLKAKTSYYKEFQEDSCHSEREKQKEHLNQENSSPLTPPDGVSSVISPALPKGFTEADNSDDREHDDYNGCDLSYGEDTDGNSFSNESNEIKDEDEHSDPLVQLQNVLEKNVLLGSKLDFSTVSYTPTNSSTPVNGSEGGTPSDPLSSLRKDGVTGELYQCHLCSYAATSKFHFNCHLNTHFDYKCPFCDYISKTEGSLKCHVNDFHSEVPQGDWNGQRVLRKEESLSDLGSNNPSRTPSGKVRHYRCKQCNFVSVTKTLFWEHSKSHIKTEKLLNCPKCPFVTEYKHHLEYHLRNHFGSKPFKCSKCNYSCVNKSMLSSHMKSHSNIYQYKCADCSYATKYCHSLKLHLRKYIHKPATVLNIDGTPNPYPVIDVYGTRRGPRSKKQKSDDQQYPSSSQSPVFSTAHMPSIAQPAVTYPCMSPVMPSSLGLPFMYPPQVMTGSNTNLIISSPSLHKALPHPNGSSSTSTTKSEITRPSPSEASSSNWKCNMCDFTTEVKDLFSKHTLLHITTENEDLCKLYGITSETLKQIQAQHKISGMQREEDIRIDREAQKDDHNPSYENKFSSEIHKSNVPSPLSRVINSPTSSSSIFANQQNSMLVTTPLHQAQLSSGTFLFQNESSVAKPDIHFPLDLSSYNSSTKSQHANSSPDNSNSTSYSTSQPQTVYSTSQSFPVPGYLSCLTTSRSAISQTVNSQLVSSHSTPQQMSSLQPAVFDPASRSSPQDHPQTTASNGSLNTTNLPASSQLQIPSPTPRNRRKGKAVKLDRLHFALEEKNCSEQEMDLDDGTEDDKCLTAWISKESISRNPSDNINVISVPTYKPYNGNNSPPPLHPKNLKSKQISEGKTSSLIEPVRPVSKISTLAEVTGINKPIPQSISVKPLEIARVINQPIPYPRQMSSLFFGYNGLNATHNRNVITSPGPYFNFPYHSFAMTSGIPERPLQTLQSSEQNGNETKERPSSRSEEVKSKWQDAYTCSYCDMAFQDCVMYTVHMGYHGYQDPFTCNMCGQQNKDKVSFFLHIARSAHQ
ncbi:protein hunchback-like [Limulus polyphemus]|uniref:Protein hunchback n=1 Tax=Limulus polyphemus TaxID=6850 RepID=A0ABM1B0E9_LIMPO|nr:protein hunchback-like [Limulus polyphemus]